MVFQLVLGTFLICISVAIHSGFVIRALVSLQRHRTRRAGQIGLVREAGLLTAATIWMMGAHTVSVWLWAVAYLELGAFDSLEPAVYFSVVCFTTLGFGDIVLGREWRILTGLTAANGLILFGFSTAFLIETMSKVDRALR